MKKVLFVNACVRQNSRTLALARDVIRRIEGEIVELNLEREALAPLDREALQKRELLLHEGKWSDPMLRYARQFAEADEIVIAAPFWDLSFPALLKIYLEQITVVGVTFEYREGRPRGLCRARRLSYITTSGGPIIEDFGYPYLRALAKNFYGIPQTVAYRAMMLDVAGISPERVLEDAEISVIE